MGCEWAGDSTLEALLRQDSCGDFCDWLGGLGQTAQSKDTPQSLLLRQRPGGGAHPHFCKQAGLDGEDELWRNLRETWYYEHAGKWNQVKYPIPDMQRKNRRGCLGRNLTAEWMPDLSSEPASCWAKYTFRVPSWHCWLVKLKTRSVCVL